MMVETRVDILFAHIINASYNCWGQNEQMFRHPGGSQLRKAL